MKKRQVSIKVTMDEELYQYYLSLPDGTKGKVIREALFLYRDFCSITSPRSMAEIITEIRNGFAKLENIPLERPSAEQPSPTNEQPTPKGPEEDDLSDMFDGFIQFPDE